MVNSSRFRGGVIVCVAAAASLTSPEAADLRLPPGTIWVTERTDGRSSVAALDAATGATLAFTYDVGNNPIGITAAAGTGKVYSSDEGANQVSVIDKETLAVRHIPTGSGSRPHHLMASRNGKYVYVALFGTNTVGVIDTQTDEKVADITVSKRSDRRTHAVWITANGRFLYATNEGTPSAGPGSFSKFDLKTGQLLWEYEQVGNRPSEVLVDDDIAYVSVRNDHVIRVYDVSGEPELLGVAEANFQPDTLSLTNDKRTLIVGLRANPPGVSARMALIDTDAIDPTQVVVPTYRTLPGTITGHQWLSSDGRVTFIALEGTPGKIAVVDNWTLEVITYDYPNKLTRPHGVFFEQPRYGQ